MDAILGQTTDYGRRRKLKAMTEGLDLKDFYGTTIERIKEQGGEKARLGMAALMWISHSERLLQLDELLHALAVEIGSTDLNAKNIPSLETLLSSCLGLLVVDGEASIIRLIHFSLQEYLHTCPDFFGPTHSIMAETCLTYLNFQTIKVILSIPKSTWERSFLLRSTPFLEYSSLYWGVHAKREASEDVVSLALQLFSQIETHISTKLLLEHLKPRASQWHQDIPTNGPLIGFTGLHCASVFGITELATSLMDQPNYDLNKRDFLGITPLIWAARCGQEEVAKLLLEQRSISPDKLGGRPRLTALAWGAAIGHEGIVRLLLGRASRRPGLVKMVWGKRYVNPDRPGKYGQTLLSLASHAGHEGVVKLLLGRKDVKPNRPDNSGRTPLSLAAGKGRDGVVELLLAREDVNPNMADYNRQSPLMWAAERGHDRVVELLLGREDIDTDEAVFHGRTPLWWAAKRGHGRVVELLLGWENINLNMIDCDGQTPLSWAAVMGHDRVVELLLGREDLNLNMVDCYDGRTPLSWAAEKGHDRVVELLLGREDLNPNMVDNDGRTPFLWATINWNNRAAKLLLGREDVNPDIPDKRGQTPLLWATRDGNHEVARLLLRR